MYTGWLVKAPLEASAAGAEQIFTFPPGKLVFGFSITSYKVCSLFLLA